MPSQAAAGCSETWLCLRWQPGSWTFILSCRAVCSFGSEPSLLGCERLTARLPLSCQRSSSPGPLACILHQSTMTTPHFRRHSPIISNLRRSFPQSRTWCHSIILRYTILIDQQRQTHTAVSSRQSQATTSSTSIVKLKLL